MKRRVFGQLTFKKLLVIVTGFLAVLVIIYSISVVVRTTIDSPKILETALSSERTPLQVESLSEEQLRILLTVEDPNFYSHGGVDFGTPGAGWTTITQGLVKIYFYNGFTPGTFHYRKFEQSLIALAFDRQVDKRTQLLLFINSAYFGTYHGQDVIGFKEAAAIYFHKEFADLTREEYISLIAMLVGPNTLNVLNQPDENHRRVRRIEHLLNNECKPGSYTDIYYDECSPD